MRTILYILNRNYFANICVNFYMRYSYYDIILLKSLQPCVVFISIF